jgi:hypothetical protein
MQTLLTDSDFEGNHFLTRAEANARFEIVQDVSYTLALALCKGGVSYQGSVKIEFTCNLAKNLFVDYTGKSISLLKVNGTQVTDEEVFRGHRINIKASLLLPNQQNCIEVNFESNFVTNN